MQRQSIEAYFFSYLSAQTGKPIKSLADLEALETRPLLELIQSLDDQLLGLFIHIIKQSNKKAEFFEKLMGEHEEDNRMLVDDFFSRYMKLILPEEEETHYFNPLSFYLPPETHDDLTFVQSRMNFFLRQTIDTINEYFLQIFEEPTNFKTGEQEKAWHWFWSRVLSNQ